MSYKWSTGSVRRGDIYYEDDRTGAATYIDFGEDTITLRPSASAILFAKDDAIGIGTTDPQTTLHIVGGTPNFRVQDTDTNYTFTVDGTLAGGMRWHMGDMDSSDDAFISMGAYNGYNRLDTAARDFHIYGTNTTVGFYFDESEGAFGFGTTTPYSTLQIAGSLQLNVTVFASSDTLDETHHVAVADCNAADVTLTLPAATAAITGRQYIIKRADSSNSNARAFVIAPGSGDDIDGADSDITNIDDGTSHTLICIGSVGWIIVDKYVGI